jgi:hypothetical protein
MGEIRTALSRNFKEQIAFPGQPRETTGSRGRNLQWFPRGHLSRFVDVRVVSMRVAVSVLRANGWPRVIAALAAIRRILRSSGSAVVVAAAVTAPRAIASSCIAVAVNDQRLVFYVPGSTPSGRCKENIEHSS